LKAVVEYIFFSSLNFTSSSSSSSSFIFLIEVGMGSNRSMFFFSLFEIIFPSQNVTWISFIYILTQFAPENNNNNFLEC
jgi:hypothetical protein